MAKDRKAARRALVLGGIAAIVAGGAWLAQRGANGVGKPAEGLVRVDMPAVAASSPPSPAPTPATNLPTLPDKVIAHVRQAYPLLTEVDFRCDAGGCAVTATIPPPTGDTFLKQRQEMLLGGLADVFGRKIMFVGEMAIFPLFLVLLSASPSFPLLVIFLFGVGFYALCAKSQSWWNKASNSGLRAGLACCSSTPRNPGRFVATRVLIRCPHTSGAISCNDGKYVR